ncbi:hypothetical protein [Desulfonema magnum]|uniref:Uncharacterized protein n=1 Tax=Desulfonema magnum TaxID=45655 RepID=A0A975GLF4_9BACT|nr:hypothetical protein [Desulfonema magnum]QTA85781.1 Uncharacterized protein dnm_017960 [Desulfonema magnum]
MAKKKNNPRLKVRTDRSFQKKSNCRDERVAIVDIDKITFSFKDVISNHPKGNMQSFESWQKDKILSKLLEKLRYLSELTIQEAKQQGFITEYNKFPDNTDFKCPKQFKDGARWSVIKKITGQKTRIVRHIVDNIFYIVFLDKDHQFWKTKKKHT